MTDRAAIYVRVSTTAQKDNTSIDTQIEACRQYAQLKGYTLVADPFIDDISSSEETRPGLSAVQSFLLREGFDVLIVLSIDRLARDPYLLKLLETQIEETGARVEFAQGQYEQSPEGELIKSVIANMARYENVKRTERSMRGKLETARRGKMVGRAPYGYEKSEDACGIRIVKREAKIIKRIFDLYTVNRESIRGIAEGLNREGVISPRVASGGSQRLQAS